MLILKCDTLCIQILKNDYISQYVKSVFWQTTGFAPLSQFLFPPTNIKHTIQCFDKIVSQLQTQKFCNSFVNVLNSEKCQLSSISTCQQYYTRKLLDTLIVNFRCVGLILWSASKVEKYILCNAHPLLVHYFKA